MRWILGWPLNDKHSAGKGAGRQWLSVVHEVFMFFKTTKIVIHSIVPQKKTEA